MRRILLLLVSAVALASCGAGTRALTGGTLVDWPTYHGTNARSGFVASGPSGSLTQAWTKNLTGAVYGEPLVVGSTLVVATEENHVYGLDARTGAQLWDTQLGTPQPLSGLPCGNISPLGITGTPAYDAATGSVFVVAETTGGHHTLWALSPTDGARRWKRSLDTQTNRNPKAEQQRGALLVVGRRVFTVFGGLAGDCDNYVGYVTSAPTSGTGEIYSYHVPTAREAGMWAPPGPVLGRNGHIYVASGNGAELRGRWDKSDSVVELSPVALRELSVFSPGSWRDDNARDLDLGSLSPVPVPVVNRIVISGKRGTVYLLKPTLGGVASAVTNLGGCKAFGGAARRGSTVLLPCQSPYGIRALRVGASSLSWSWTANGIFGAPVIAGDKVYVADRNSGSLVVLSRATGQVLQRLPVGNLTHFPSEVVSGDYVFVPSLTGVTAFRGQ